MAEACNDMHNGNLGDKFRPNIKCIDNLCQCGPGYKWTQVNVTIQRVLETEGVDWAYHIMECHKSSVAPTSCIDKDNRRFLLSQAQISILPCTDKFQSFSQVSNAMPALTCSVIM